MRLGNRHLVAKIAAMQEAADNILQAAPGQINGQSHSLMQQQINQLSPGNNSTDGSSSPHKGKSPSAFAPLTDISEEENPLQSLSGGDPLQSPDGRGPRVLETSIDIVIQSESSRTHGTGDNGQENNLNDGFHPLAQGSNTSSDKEAEGSQGENELKPLSDGNIRKSVTINENTQIMHTSPSSTPTEKTRSSPSAKGSEKDKKKSPSKHSEDSSKADGILKGKHQKSGEHEGANHKDSGGAASSSPNTGGTSGSQKIVLDLDDKSRFTEEITV